MPMYGWGIFGLLFLSVVALAIRVFGPGYYWRLAPSDG